MKRVDIKNSKSPNFIGCWYLEDKNISNNIIDFFGEIDNFQQLIINEIKIVTYV